MPYKLIEARHGFMFYNPHDLYVGKSFDEYGEFSEGEIDMFKELIGPGHIVLDIGANIGAHTLWFAQRACHVFAFEPQRLIYQMLCANMVVNNIHNVTAHQAIVGEGPGTGIVPTLEPDMDNNFGGLWAHSHTEGEPVPVICLDQLDFNRLDFIKIDAEGMEVDILKGGLATITQHQPLMYIEDDREEKRIELREIITSYGYEFVEHNPRLFNSDNFKKGKSDVFPGTVSQNLMCSPKGAQIPRTLQ